MEHISFAGKDERTKVFSLKKRIRSWTDSNSHTLKFHPVREPCTIMKEVLKEKSDRLIQKSVIHTHLDEQLICKKLASFVEFRVAMPVYLYPPICCYYYWYSAPSRTITPENWI